MGRVTRIDGREYYLMCIFRYVYNKKIYDDDTSYTRTLYSVMREEGGGRREGGIHYGDT